jgi:hypothetical protein
LNNILFQLRILIKCEHGKYPLPLSSEPYIPDLGLKIRRLRYFVFYVKSRAQAEGIGERGAEVIMCS